MKFDAVDIVLILIFSTWAAASLIDVYRGTAHVSGCDCIVHYDKSPADAGDAGDH